jgi:hypothetical protein
VGGGDCGGLSFLQPATVNTIAKMNISHNERSFLIILKFSCKLTLAKT